MYIPKIVVLASWSGTGFETMQKQIIAGKMKAEIIKVISNRKNPWVKEKAEKYGIPFEYIPWPYTADVCQNIVFNAKEAVLFALSWCLVMIDGNIPTEWINIHPGPLTEEYSGKWMYGHHVHEKIFADFQAGKIKRSCISIHYAIPGIYDDPNGLICQIPIELQWCTNAEEVAQRVNAVEHERQWKITEMVANGEISAQRNHIDKKIINMKFPENYTYRKPISLDTQKPYGEF
jgi:phosphoribosylglycinamide formyltransferase-1